MSQLYSKDTIHVATTSNEAYFPGLCILICSLLQANSGKNSFVLHVFDTGISTANQNRLQHLLRAKHHNAELVFHKIDQTCFKGLVRDYGGGYSTYARLLIGSLIDAKRVIYIDCDFLVLRDVAPLWFHAMNNNVMLATRDYDTIDGRPGVLSNDCPFETSMENQNIPYFTCGFLLVDLEAWRRNSTEALAFKAIPGYESKLKAWDQTVLNYILRGKIGEIEREWSLSCSWVAVPIQCNIHYISKMKPWNSYSSLPAHRLWWMFHASYIEMVTPLSLPCKIKLKGIVRNYRDIVLARVKIARHLYFKIKRSRGTSEKALEYFDRGLNIYENYLNALPDDITDLTVAHYNNIWNSKVSK